MDSFHLHFILNRQKKDWYRSLKMSKFNLLKSLQKYG